MQIAKQIEIQLKSGEVLTLDMTEKLVEQIKSAFDLKTSDQVTEGHVKYFLAASMKNMLEAADATEATH
jgi:hypothetical protein